MQKALTPNSAVIPEPNSREERRKNISGLLNRAFICIDYKSMKVGIEGDCLYVWNPNTGKRLGGRLILDLATVEMVEEWLEAKADWYEVDQW